MLYDGFLTISSKLLGIFKFCFFRVKEQQKIYKTDAKNLQEHNISKKKYAFMLKKSKISPNRQDGTPPKSVQHS